MQGALFLSKGAMQKFKFRASTQEQGCRLGVSLFGFGSFACARDVTASRTSSVLTSRNNMALASFRNLSDAIYLSLRGKINRKLQKNDK